MSLDIERLRIDHLVSLELQDQQSYLQPALSQAYASDLLAQKGVAWAAVLDGKTIACAGILEIWEQRAQGWAMFSAAALRNFVAIHRMGLSVLADAPWARVEIAVDRNHLAAIRWAERLGFQREGLMRCYTADGRDCFLYSRVKP